MAQRSLSFTALRPSTGTVGAGPACQTGRQPGGNGRGVAMGLPAGVQVAVAVGVGLNAGVGVVVAWGGKVLVGSSVGGGPLVAVARAVVVPLARGGTTSRRALARTGAGPAASTPSRQLPAAIPLARASRM